MSVNIPQFDMLGRLLDVAALRHRVIANNLANVNTPGYHRLDVSFEDAFARTLQRQGVDRAVALQPHVIETKGGTVRSDGNSVDLDQELGQLSKNALMYLSFNQFLGGQIAMMRSAITGS